MIVFRFGGMGSEILKKFVKRNFNENDCFVVLEANWINVFKVYELKTISKKMILNFAKI